MMKVDRRVLELPDNDIARMKTRGILHYLNSMDSANAIVRILMFKKQFGFPYQEMRSPLGAYIASEIGGETQVMVSPGWVCVYSAERHRAEWRVPVSLKAFPTIRKFLWGFDLGFYPGLFDTPQN